ncbi:polysaccharide lyase [Nibricoccus aquaticus]|uniref:Polysaccharide lyase n=1 Tax=Nibricoccus aquaticus TaxID=2576891 RepID=A0A290QEZ1_9BACT|nr:polysaccharide lyase [Nibricoccus aquaticus]ATC63898.1 polysaccharide lyase [Nibricoccus aquaticus]
MNPSVRHPRFSRTLYTLLALGTAATTFAAPERGQIPPHPPRMNPTGIPAFPGAWGGGMFTTGGRGGQVITVTNLNDSGLGSFRAALETPGPRIVIFRVAGTIHLDTNLDINHPDITIAGQSAPGDGICIAGQSLNINTHNVIVRHLRARRGDPKGGQGSDNIGGNPEGQIIIDHCSTSWGMDENLSLYRHMQKMPEGPDIKNATEKLTIQWSISSEALNNKKHAFGGTWGGKDSTFHHNLFASNTARNPSIGMSGAFDFRNNVIFNWGHRTMDGGDETSLVNVINNYYKPGPAASADMVSTMIRIEQRSQYSPGSAWAEGDWYVKEANRPGKWYVAGNVMHGNDDVTDNNWKGVRGPEQLARVNTPFEGWPVPQQTAEAAFESVLAKAGATLPRRDAVDTRVTEMVRTGKVSIRNGIINNPEEVGGYPNLTFDPAKVPVDTDNDGMPDAWELKHGLNPNDASDGALDSDNDGYTNVEEFLNGTNPREKLNYRNLANNVDTISG